MAKTERDKTARSHLLLVSEHSQLNLNNQKIKFELKKKLKKNKIQFKQNCHKIKFEEKTVEKKLIKIHFNN